MHTHSITSWRRNGLAALCALCLARPAAAQAPTTYQACYVPSLGALYLIGLPGLPTACLSTTHVAISWTSGGGVSGTAGGDLSGTYPNPTLARLQGTLTTTSGFAVTGGSGAIPVTGAGTRLMWYPGKAAFRAGAAGTTEWDDANVGQWSTALGNGGWASGMEATTAGVGSTASGQGAVAMGVGAAATNFAATAFGRNPVASGQVSVAMGWQSAASGTGAVAMGWATVASADSSTAMGAHTTASGIASVAMGTRTTASGQSAVAMGTLTTASGGLSTAMGGSTAASGWASFAVGAIDTASAYYTVATGYHTVASGNNSTAMGQAASTNGFAGSFVYGDASTTNVVSAARANEFEVRAAGGFVFATSSDLAFGCSLPAGSGSWGCASSRLLKTDFEPLAGETVLARVRALPVELWSYRAEPGVRHLGTFAEDFRRAFGLGTDSTTIGSIDMDGVNLAAVQALELRTRELKEQLDAKDREIGDLSRQLAELRERLERLEAARR